MSWEVPAGGIGSANFTNTGLGYDGTNLLIGDFDNERIVKTTLAGAYVGEVVLASAPNNSVQGVAYDSSDGTYWVCHYGASTVGTVKHYSAAGALLGTIACAVATTGPNGCVYDAVNDRVLTTWDDGHMRSYNCATGSATPVEDVTLAASLGTGSGAGPDGIALDPTDPATYIWVSADAPPASVNKVNRSSGAVVSSWVGPTAVEGLVWISGRCYLCCDTGYHASIPNGNRVFIFDASGNEIQGSSFLSNLVYADLNTTTGNQIISGVGFRPTVVLALGAPTIAQQATAIMCAGAFDNQYHQWAMQTRLNDNDSATPFVNHEFATTKCIARVDSAGGTFASAAYTSMTHDGFTLSVTNGGAAVHRCAFLCLGGDDFRGNVGTFNSATSTGVQAITGVGFQPKAVLIATNKSNSTPGIVTTSARWSMGAMTAADQWAVDTFMSDSAPQTVYGSQETTHAMLRTSSTSTYSLQAAYSSMDSDGFSININPAPGAAVIWGYVALGGSIRVKAGTFSQPSSTGAQAITGVGFTPAQLLFASASASAAGPQSQTRPSYGLAESSTKRVAYGNSATNGSSPTQAGRQASESLCITHNSGTGTTVTAAADFTSMDADGFTVNWSTADATARKEYYLAIAELPAEVSGGRPRWLLPFFLGQ